MTAARRQRTPGRYVRRWPTALRLQVAGGRGRAQQRAGFDAVGRMEV